MFVMIKIMNVYKPTYLPSITIFYLHLFTLGVIIIHSSSFSADLEVGATLGSSVTVSGDVELLLPRGASCPDYRYLCVSVTPADVTSSYTLFSQSTDHIHCADFLPPTANCDGE